MKKSTKDIAIDRVEANPKNYAKICYEFAVRSIRRRKKFTSEDLISAYESNGYPIPKEGRVWGAVIRKLKSEGLIRHYGFGTYQNPSGHAKPVNIWKTV